MLSEVRACRARERAWIQTRPSANPKKRVSSLGGGVYLLVHLLHQSLAALVQIGRVATVGAMLVAIVWAPQIARFETLFGYLQSAYSYVTPPVVAVFLVGIMWTRFNRHGAFWTLATIIPVGAVFFILNEVMGVFNIQFLYAAAISFVISLVVLIGVSLLTAAPERASGRSDLEVRVLAPGYRGAPRQAPVPELPLLCGNTPDLRPRHGNHLLVGRVLA